MIDFLRFALMIFGCDDDDDDDSRAGVKLYLREKTCHQKGSNDGREQREREIWERRQKRERDREDWGKIERVILRQKDIFWESIEREREYLERESIFRERVYLEREYI